MMTIERISGLAGERRAQYENLVREAGACDANGDELPVADLDQLDSLIQSLGVSTKQISEDLGASRSWHIHRTQLAEAQEAAPTAQKAVVRCEADLETAIAERNALQQERATPKQADGLKTAREGITWLSNDLKAARVPLSRIESATRQLALLASKRPWLKGDE